MPAADPSLRRLLALAAVPAQRAQAWRALEAALGALDCPLDSQAAESADRIDALMRAPPLGQRLLPALARLAPGVTAQDAAETPDRDATARAPQRGSGRSDLSAELSAGGHWPAPAVPGTSAQRPAAARARWPEMAQPPAHATGGPAWMARRDTPGFAAESAGPGRDAMGAQGLRGRAAPADPAAARASVAPIPAALRMPLALALAVERLRPVVGARRAMLPIDEAAAQAAWQARWQDAELASAWHQALAVRRLAGEATRPSSADPGESGAGTLTIARDDAPWPAGAGVAPPQRRPAGSGPRVADWPGDPHTVAVVGQASAPHAMLTDTGALAAAAAGALAGPPPLQAGARIGGFKGLAALGQALAAAPVGPAPVAAALAPTSGVPAEAGPIDPRALMDELESILRQQAARSGIHLGGLEP